MSDEIYFEGNRFISAKDAAIVGAISRDYIARLARNGKIKSKRIGKNWYVEEVSFKHFLSLQEESHEVRKSELAEARKREYQESLQRNALAATAAVLPEITVTENEPKLHHVHSMRTAIEKVMAKQGTSSIHMRVSPLYVAHPVFDLAHKITALVTVLVLVFGTYSFVYPESMQSAYLAARTAVASTLVKDHANTQVAAVAGSGFFDTTVDFFRNLFGINRGEVQVSVLPYNPPTATTPRTTQATVLQPITQTITQPVIERVRETVRTVSGGVTESYLNARLAAMMADITKSFELLSTNSLRQDELLSDSLSGGGGGVSDASDLTGILAIEHGGTGTSNAPSYGQLLLGNSSGGYDLVATSSLGITGGSGTFIGLTDVPGSLAVGDLLYADAPDNLATLPVGTNGQVLKMVGGLPQWAADLQGSGGAGAWATSTDDLALYPADTSDVVIVGSNATSTTGNILEVVGNALFRGAITAYNTFTGSRFVATSSVASIFPYASSTGISVSGTGYFGTASTSNLTISNLPNSLLATNAQGAVIATTSIGSNLIDTTGNWSGTFDGLEGASYLANSFSTTSASYFSSLGLAFSTTSSDYWKSVNNFFSTTSAQYFASVTDLFSTTSANYWETQQTARTADDLTNNSIEDLNDVAAMTENYGDLLAWNGSTWTDFATSSLSIALADTTGTLGATRGGTGLSSITAAGILLGNYAGTGWQQLATSTLGLLTTNVAEGSNQYFTNARVQTYLDTVDKGFFFSTTSATHFAHASTTIPKTYTNNTFTGTNVFANATSTTLGITSLLNCDLKTNADGSVYCGVDATGGGGSSFGQTFEIVSNSYLAPTTTLGVIISASSTISSLSTTNSTSTNATSTNLFATNGRFTNATTTSFGINSETFTDLTGTGLTNSGGVLTLDTTGNWSGTFDGLEGSAYLANSFSTTSANYFSALGLAFSTTSTDYYKSVNNFFSTTSANHWSSLGLAFSTTSANYFLAQNQGSSFSTTSADYYVHSSTTIPKTYSTNTFTGANTFSSGLLSIGSTTIVGNATTTGMFGAGSIFVNSDRITDFTGTGLTLSAGALTLDTSGNWSGTFDGQEGSYYLANSFSTTSASNFSALGLAFSTTSADNWKSVNNFFSTTSANHYSSLGLAFSTTSANYFLSQNLGNAFSTTSADYYVHSSTTIPKLYSTNTFTGANTFSSLVTVSNLLATGSTTLQNFTFANATGTAATTSAFAISGIASGSLLKTTTGGAIIAATAGTDYANFAYPFPSNATTTMLTFSGGLLSIGSTTIVGNATTTGMFGAGSIFVNNDRITDFTGTGLTLSAGALTLDTSGNWSGTFDGLEGSAYLANSFSTTSANYFSALGLAFSTTSLDYYKSVNNFFSTTSASHFSSLGLAFSTTSANHYSSLGLAFSTTSANYFLSQNLGNAFSTTSADYYVHSSTTIPKLYSTNTFTGANTFSNLVTVSNLLATGSTTLLNFTANNATTSQATTTALAISGIASGSLLKTTTGGAVIAAVLGTDYQNFAFPWTPGALGNSTSTRLIMTNGLMATASSTIGDGTQTGGLTVSGGATTTGSAYIAGTLGVGTNVVSSAKLNILTDPSNSGLSIRGTNSSANAIAWFMDEGFNTKGYVGYFGSASAFGTFAGNLNTIAGANTNIGFGYYDGGSVQRYNQFINSAAGRIGMGTTTPMNLLTLATTTEPQLALSAGGGSAQWTFRNAGGNFFLSTTTLAGTATTSSSALSISSTGNATTTLSTLHLNNSATTTSNFGYSITSGCFMLPNGTCATSNTGTVTGTGSSGRVAYWDGSGSITSASSFTFDGSTLAAAEIQASSANPYLYVNDSDTATADFRIAAADGAAQIDVDINNSAANSYLSFGVDSRERARFATNNAFLIGTTTGYASTTIWGNTNGKIFEVVTNASSSALSVAGDGFGTTTVTGLTISGSATSTSNVGFNITTGCYAVNGSCLTPVTGTAGQFAYFSGTNTAVGTSSIFLDTNTNVGIGTTSPYAKLSVVGEVVARNFTATSTTATSTFAGGLNIGNGALTYDFSSGLTSIENLAIGSLEFDADSGVVAWTDMPVTSASTIGTVNSYSAQIDGTPILTVYSTSNGAGGIAATSTKVGIGTTTPYATLAVQAAGVQTAPLLEVASTSSATKFLSVSGTGFGTTTLAGLAIVGSATSTSDVGFNITTGCFAVGGVCIGGSSSSFSTTSANYWSSLGLAFSTTSANLYSSLGLAFSTTSADYYTHSSTTIPKLYSSNTFTGTNTFSGGLTTIANILATGSTTLLNFTAGNATTSQATTTALAITGIASGSLLKTTTGGAVIAAVLGTDYQNFAFPFTPTNNFGVNTNATSTVLSLLAGFNASSTVRFGNSGVSNFLFNSTSGNLGLGTTTPFRTLSITGAVSTAQQAIAYDSTNYTDFLTSSTGDLFTYPSGKDVLANDSNLWVCTGGTGNTNGCPSGTPSGEGNLIVETRVGIATSTPNWALEVAGTRPSIALSDTGAGGTNLKHWLFSSMGGNLYIGTTTDLYATSTPAAVTMTNAGFVGLSTSTPTQMLSVKGKLFVGADGATGLGTATSTFQGDIKITGKLDVGTIDPPYTIDGMKYATYVASMTGVKEETTQIIQLDTLNEKTGKYETVINFDELEKDSDLWLFYQVTKLGERFEKLVVQLTPAFDGQVFYTKDAEKNTLTISGSKSGEVSLRLTADRFDSEKWPNVRFDQDGNTEGTHVISSKQPGGLRSAAAAVASWIR